MKKNQEAYEKYLVDNGFLKAEQLNEVQTKCRQTKEKFKKVCLKQGYMSEERYAAVEAEFLEIPFIELEKEKIGPEILKVIPEVMIKQNGIVPVSMKDKVLTIAVSDPHNVLLMDEIRKLTRMEVRPSLATEADIWRTIQKHYQKGSIAEATKSFQQTMKPKVAAPPGTPGAGEGQFQLDFRKLMSGAGKEAPIVKLVDHIVMQAVDDRASDIHIEPEEGFVRVRYRIDGVLVESQRLPREVQSPVTSRIKIMSKLDIAEHRRPQDGKIQMKVNDKDIDIRVSSFPTTYGENIVMRILDRASSILDISKLGFPASLRECFDKMLKTPYGIIMVTGPTGAGKTTTLYAALQAINTVDKNIMTVEDPIEYQMPMIRQSQVNPKAGVTFATGLRNLLRQDPDVMLIGEIRDRETAEIAVESALTGHLVFSTLHTNDAAGAFTRLHDMGIESFLVSSSLIGVMAQRLVRKLCPHCKKCVPASELPLSDEEKKVLEMIRKKYSSEIGAKACEGPMQLYRPTGCAVCKNIGFLGRFGIYELLSVDEKIRGFIARNAPTSEVREYGFNDENLPMKHYGFLRALAGDTTLEEVLKVVQTD